MAETGLWWQVGAGVDFSDAPVRLEATAHIWVLKRRHRRPRSSAQVGEGSPALSPPPAGRPTPPWHSPSPRARGGRGRATRLSERGGSGGTTVSVGPPSREAAASDLAAGLCTVACVSRALWEEGASHDPPPVLHPAPALVAWERDGQGGLSERPSRCRPRSAARSLAELGT
ncbi:hypothetical protein NDU88_007026 [Pleurodeles waltl]|uniref:Uncharacterized protein n=1 Tax=Pleurodeles waltl TaxID=8319 RepID=A0AAV7QKI8_PLEWA|nr:hypothetical protein NDU88_007026 [Pleurodeles waltl]